MRFWRPPRPRSVLPGAGEQPPRHARRGPRPGALEAGLFRYCPICDGYAVTDKRVGVIGTGDHGMRELFLRGYTPRRDAIARTAATISIRRARRRWTMRVSPGSAALR